MNTRHKSPAYVRVSPVHVDGRPSQRLMVVLRTRGCEYARRNDGGCSVCGFLNHAEEDISDQDILAQLDGTLAEADLAGVTELDLLTLGSFLNDREIEPELRRRLLERVGSLDGVRRVSFESRAEYVTTEELRACKALLGERTLELGIGLESADDHVRNDIVRKGLSREAFHEVIAKAASAGLDLLVYLLIKPPGLSEAAAIDDAVASAQYVFSAAREHGVRARVAFEPVFVCENTVLEELYTSSDYRLVSLWSVATVLEEIHGLGEIFVGLSDEDLARHRLPYSCERCYVELVGAIEDYNATQDLTALRGVKCECRDRYLEELAGGAR